MLERPISSSVSPGRRWFGYGPYKPVMVGKLLDIFRVFYNFVEVGKNKETLAMRLGLAKGKITIEDILYYQQQNELQFFTMTAGKDIFPRKRTAE